MKFFLLVSLISVGALAKPNTLGVISAEKNKQSTSIEVKFTGPKPTKSQNLQVEDHGTFLQVKIANMIVPNPGEFFDAPGPYITKIAAFQTGAKTAAVRFFVNTDAAIVKQGVKVDYFDDRILLSTDHTKIQNLVSTDPKNTAAKSGVPSADDVINSTAVKDNIPAPAASLSKIEGLNLKDTSNMQQNLIKAALFSIVMIMGLAAFYMARAMRKRRKKATGGGEPEQTLSSIGKHILSAKQHIELIQVNGQKILIGVTPENINFLTTVNAPQQVQASPPRVTQAPRLQPRKTEAPVREKPRIPKEQKIQRRINVQIDESGIKEKNTEALSDVTKLIREKLRNLPKT